VDSLKTREKHPKTPLFSPILACFCRFCQVCPFGANLASNQGHFFSFGQGSLGGCPPPPPPLRGGGTLYTPAKFEYG